MFILFSFSTSKHFINAEISDIVYPTKVEYFLVKREIVKMYSMQFGFMSGRSMTYAIFIVRQLQEKYLVKNKELWMAFVDLHKHLTGCLRRWFGGH